MKRRFVRRRLIQTPYNSGDRRRSVPEDVRPKKERLDPGRGQRCNLRKPGCELRPGNERGLRRMFIAASGNQCDRTTVLRAIRVAVNARVQLRRDAQRERPEHARKCGNAPSCSSRPELATAEHAAQAISGSARVLACRLWQTFPEGWGTQRIAFTRRPARAPIAVREARALPGLNALHHSLLFSVAVTLR